MSDIGRLIERFLNIKLEQLNPGDPNELRERWFYMRSPLEERLDFTTEREELISRMPETDIVSRGDERRICLRACYGKKFDDATRTWITDYDRTGLHLKYSSMLSEEDRKWYKDHGYIKKIVDKDILVLPRSDSGLLLLTRDEIININSCLERAIEYEKAKIRMVYQLIAQANKQSKSHLSKVPIDLQASIAGFLGSSVVHDDLERTQYALQFLNTPQPSGAGADPKPDDDMRLAATTIQKTWRDYQQKITHEIENNPPTSETPQRNSSLLFMFCIICSLSPWLISYLLPVNNNNTEEPEPVQPFF